MRRVMILFCLILFAYPLFAKEATMSQADEEHATFAGGCFWCMQPFFDRTPGVKSTTVGFTDGKVENPTYEEVSTGETGHAEAIDIVYDPKQVSYERLLKIYWHNIDPTLKDGQFVDMGSQYRTAIYYHTPAQKQMAEQSKQELEKSGRFSSPIVTEIKPATAFYPAEDYHQKYYQKNAMRYKQYHAMSGREEFKNKFWEKE